MTNRVGIAAPLLPGKAIPRSRFAEELADREDWTKTKEEICGPPEYARTVQVVRGMIDKLVRGGK